jgi:hypothetical protein
MSRADNGWPFQNTEPDRAYYIIAALCWMWLVNAICGYEQDWSVSCPLHLGEQRAYSCSQLHHSWWFLETEGKAQCQKHLQKWFQASAAMLMRTALFRDITQYRVVILFRRFGTIYRWSFQGSRSRRRKPFFLDFFDPWICDQYVFPKRRYRSIILRCVIYRKSADLTCRNTFYRSYGSQPLYYLLVDLNFREIVFLTLRRPKYFQDFPATRIFGNVKVCSCQRHLFYSLILCMAFLSF